MQPQSPINCVVQEEATELPQEVLCHNRELDEVISHIHELGLQVDNDRELAPGDIPSGGRSHNISVPWKELVMGWKLSTLSHHTHKMGGRLP